MSAYEKLETHAREINRLREVMAIIHWDEACMMPTGSGAGRAEAMASLATTIHARATDPAIGDLLEQARGSNEPLDDWQRANLVEMDRQWVEATAVPADLVRHLSVATSRCEQRWREARARNDWASVLPRLEEVVGLTRTRAQALADATGLAPYDALLDGYEPELRSADVDVVFADLKAFLPALIDSAIARQQAPQPLVGPFPVEQQRRLCEAVMRLLGFDFERGRLDVSHHPFCGGVPDDTRITTRYREHEFLDAFMATCHETGHALYQQGLPVPWRDQPVGDALGAAVHESQSLLMELQVCRSREFVTALAPLIREHLGRSADDEAWSADNLYRHATRVSRSLIRVEADETTYPLHVILRYEIEQQLMSGALDVADLPEAWNDAMARYLQMDTRGDYANGCMQDVHWFAGLFGYFPTYTLGALMAAQWFATACEAEPGIVAGIGRAELAPLLGWLRRNVHGQGRRLTMQPLLESVTGTRLNADFFKRHLERRYLGGA
ncbi:MAG: carboxypeptidase M32 [Pseudomonadales bacterium]